MYHSLFVDKGLKQRGAACKYAKLVLDRAVSKLDSLPEESRERSAELCQKLRDKIGLWTDELEKEKEQKEREEKERREKETQKERKERELKEERQRQQIMKGFKTVTPEILYVA